MVQGDEFVNRAGTLYNYNPTNHYQRPQDKINTGFSTKYSITDKAEFYADVRFMSNDSPSQIAYSGTFGDLRSIPVITQIFQRSNITLYAETGQALEALTHLILLLEQLL